MRRVWPFTLRGTGALALALAAFIAARELGLVELVYFGVLLLGVVAASLVSVYVTQRSDSVERTLDPDVVAVGAEASVTVRVGARSALPTAAGRWRDELPRGLAGEAEGRFPSLGSGLRGGARTVDLSYRVRGAARGVHQVGPLEISTTDPFALVRRTVVLGRRTRVTVSPAVVELATISNRSGDTGGMLQVADDRLGQGSDNLTPRAYSPGDSMRRIHWRATAHRDELMVRQEEQESTPEATIVLDRAALRWTVDAMRAPGMDPGFEAAVSACVSAAARFVRDGYSVDIVDSDGRAIVEPITGGDLAEVSHVVAMFAALVARDGDALGQLPHVFAGVRTGPVVLIVGRLDPRDADALAPIVHHTTLPVLLAAAPAADALTRAAEHGWHTARLDPDRDLGLTWSEALEQGADRVAG